MAECNPTDDESPTVASIRPSPKGGARATPRLIRASESDLLDYVSGMLTDLEALTTGARLESVTDALGFVHRVVERQRDAL